MRVYTPYACICVCLCDCVCMHRGWWALPTLDIRADTHSSPYKREQTSGAKRRDSSTENHQSLPDCAHWIGHHCMLGPVCSVVHMYLCVYSSCPLLICHGAGCGEGALLVVLLFEFLSWTASTVPIGKCFQHLHNVVLFIFIRLRLLFSILVFCQAKNKIENENKTCYVLAHTHTYIWSRACVGHLF